MKKKSRVHGDLLVGDPRKIETEDLKRSDHPDFATTSELKDMEFSGLRYNQMVGVMEFWVSGVLAKSIPAKDGVPNPTDLRKAYMEVFAIEIFEIDQLGSGN